MTRFRWAAVVLFACTSAGFGDDEAAKKDLKAMEGNWQMTLQEERGFLTPARVVSRLRIVVEGDLMTWYIGNPAANQTATIKLDPSKEPKAIDAAVSRGSANGKTMLGIYKLDKDTLEVCWTTAGETKRPEKFTSKPGPGAGTQYAKYERKAEGKADPPPIGKKGPEVKKDVPAAKNVRNLQATLPEGWKDDGTVLDVRRFIKDGKPGLAVFALLARNPAPASAEALAELAKKEPDIFPHRQWVKTVGIGKLPDGFFIVGVCKVMGFEGEMIGAVRTIDGQTVFFTAVPADEAAARKEMLAVIRSVQFGK
jgi:uncharacterized protein (TIGR03067 family)